MAVNFNDLERQRASDQARHISLLAGFVTTADFGNLRRRHKAAHAVEIHEETTLVVVSDLGFDDLVGLVDFLELAPALFLARAVDTDDRMPFLVFRLDD